MLGRISAWGSGREKGGGGAARMLLVEENMQAEVCRVE